MKALPQIASSSSTNIQRRPAQGLAAPPLFLDAPQETRGFVEYLQSLRRWKWTVVVFALAGVAIGLLITCLQAPVYEGTATLEVQNLNDNFLNFKQILPTDDSGAGALSDIQTQIKIVQSDAIVNPVVNQVASKPIPLESYYFSWARRLAHLFPSDADFVQKEAERMKDNLQVRAIGQTRIIEIRAKSSSPALAVDFVNRICAQYVDQNINARWEMSQNTSQALSRLLEESKRKVRESETALQAYARESQLLYTSENKNVADEKLSQLQDALSKAEAERIDAQSKYETSTKNLEGIGGELNNEFRGKLTELRRQRAELATTYTSDYGKIKRLDAQIAAMENAISSEKQEVLKHAGNDYKQAIRREKLLASSYAAQAGIVTDAAKRAIQYNILEHELEGNRQLYDEMLRQVKQASIASAVRAGNVRILDHAEFPKQRSRPKPIINCAFGLLVFTFVGLLVGHTRERADSSLREPGEGFRWMGIPELGVIPHRRDSPMLAVGRGRQSLQIVGPPSASAADTLALDDSMAAEACRNIVTSVLLAEPGKAVPRVIVITSPGPREGKTTVAANVAMTMASMGRRVLLIDGDIRRPRLHHVFGVSNETGLSRILERGHVAEQNLDSIIHRTSLPLLSMLSSGPPTVTCANLLHSRRLGELLRRFKNEYDFVLIDTPPLLPVADTRVMGRLSDGVILVVRAGQTAREAAAAAHHRLLADETPVLGLILNDWDPASSVYTYQYAPEYVRATGD
jgi:capsular exopolysaccharide synthesis family protein